MSIHSSSFIANTDNIRFKGVEISLDSNQKVATDNTGGGSKIIGVRGSGLSQKTPVKSKKDDRLDRSQRFRSTGQKQISSDGQDDNWFNFNQSSHLKPKFEPDMLAQSLFGSNFQNSTPQQVKQVTTLAYIKNQQIIDEIKKNLPIHGSDRKQWRREESRLVKPKQWIVQQQTITPKQTVQLRLNTPPDQKELIERIKNNKTEFTSHQLSYLNNIQKEIELLHDIKVHQQSTFITENKQTSLTPAGVLLIASSSFQQLLKDREFPLQPLNIKRHMEEASFVFRRILLACSDCTLKDCTCAQNSDMTESLSMLWSYIVTAVDMALSKQETRIKVLEEEQAEMVAHQVTLFRDGMERQLFGKERQLTDYFHQIEKHKETIQSLNNDIAKLNDKLQVATDLFQKLRDPQGMQDFRHLTEDFARCVGEVSRQREEQYEAIEQAMKLMESCERDINQHHSQEIAEEERRESRIKELMTLQEKLQDELNKLLEECGKPKIYHIHKHVHAAKVQVNNQEKKFELPPITQSDFGFLAFKPAGVTNDDYAKLREQIYYEMQEKLIPALEADLVCRFKDFLGEMNKKKKERTAKMLISVKCTQCGKETEAAMHQTKIKVASNSGPQGEKQTHQGQGPQPQGKSTQGGQVPDLKIGGQERAQSHGGQEFSNDYDDDKDIDNMLDDFLQSTQKARRNKFGYRGFSNIEKQWQELQRHENEKQLRNNEILEIKKTKKEQKLHRQIGDEQDSFRHIDDNFSDQDNEVKKHKNRADPGKKRGSQGDQSLHSITSDTGSAHKTVKSKLDMLQDQLKMKQKLNPSQVANNPILKALQKVLKNPTKLDKEFYFCMLPPLIYSQMDQIMQDKTYRDIENEGGAIERRIGASFPAFMYDSMLMTYGLQNISVKMIVQMANGLMNATQQQAYGCLLGRMLGLREPSLQSDEARLVIRAHTFFKMVQDTWINQTRTNFKNLEITNENEFNLNTGGECSVFEILNELKTAVYGEQCCEAVMFAIKPDILKSTAVSADEKDELSLKFSILKITNRIAKTGKDVATVFKSFDKTNSGSLGWAEIAIALRQNLYLYFTREEVKLLTRYLDEDSSGEVDLAEFQSKVTFMDYQKQSHVFMISEINFINTILGQWYIYRGDEKEKLLVKVKEADKSGDGEINVEEFTTLMHKIDSELDQNQILKLWQLSCKWDHTKPDQICFETLANVILNHKIGGWGKEFFSSWLDKNQGKYKDMKKKRK